MANQIQTFWDSMPVELHPPVSNAGAALAINAWDNITKGIGNLGTKLIEEPMSKLYRADLNAGKDISSYDPLALTNKVLEDTPTVRGQLLENDTKAFDLGIKRANEADMVKYSPQLNEARRLANAGKIKEAQDIISTIPTNIRASVLKEYLPDVDASLRDQQRIGLESGRLDLERQRLGNDLQKEQWDRDAVRIYNAYKGKVDNVIPEIMNNPAKFGLSSNDAAGIVSALLTKYSSKNIAEGYGIPSVNPDDSSDIDATLGLAPQVPQEKK